MSFTHDPEVPAGFQDADLEMAALEEQARRSAALRRRGICTHGWRLGGVSPARYSAEDIADMRAIGAFPDRPTDPRVTDQASIPAGFDLCTNCGQLVEEW